MSTVSYFGPSKPSYICTKALSPPQKSLISWDYGELLDSFLKTQSALSGLWNTSNGYRRFFLALMLRLFNVLQIYGREHSNFRAISVWIMQSLLLNALSNLFMLSGVIRVRFLPEPRYVSILKVLETVFFYKNLSYAHRVAAFWSRKMMQ